VTLLFGGFAVTPCSSGQVLAADIHTIQTRGNEFDLLCGSVSLWHDRGAELVLCGSVPLWQVFLSVSLAPWPATRAERRRCARRRGRPTAAESVLVEPARTAPRGRRPPDLWDDCRPAGS